MTTTIALRTGTGAEANIATVQLDDGTTAVAHVLVGSDGQPIGLATQADIAALNATIASQTAQIAGQAVPLTNAFGVPLGASTNAFGYALAGA